MAALESYHTDAFASSPLTFALEKTLHLLSDLCQNRRGYCWAHNASLSAMRGVHEATLGRHLKRLRELGFIAICFVGGDRRIFLSAPARTECVPAALPQRDLESSRKEQTTEAAAPVVVPPADKPAISDNSPIHADTARRFAIPRDFLARFSEAEIRQALAALDASRGVRNAPGWLVRALTQGWRVIDRPKSVYGLKIRERREERPAPEARDGSGLAALLAARQKVKGGLYAPHG